MVIRDNLTIETMIMMMLKQKKQNNEEQNSYRNKFNIDEINKLLLIFFIIGNLGLLFIRVISLFHIMYKSIQNKIYYR